MHFTKAALLALPVTDKRTWHHDDKTRGLALRISPSGRRTFYHYRWANGKPSQTSLGDLEDLSIEQARKRCEELNVAIADGAGPIEARQAAREEWTLDQLVTWYEANYSQRKARPKDDRRRIELYFAELLPIKLSAITRTKVRQLHGLARPDMHGKQIKGAGANRATMLLRAIWNAACSDEVTKLPNPAEGVRMFPEHERERRLTPDELGRFLQAVDEEPNTTVRDYLLLSAMTAARKSNMLAMAWADIDLEHGTWRIPLTKNGKPQTVALEKQETDILRARLVARLALIAEHGDDETSRPWVFPGREDGKTGHLINPSKRWKAILERAKVQDFRLHDLRRMLASIMHDSGISLSTIGKTLGHKSQAATLIYARMSLDPVRVAKRAALGALDR